MALAAGAELAADAPSEAARPRPRQLAVRKEHVDVDRDMSLEVATVVSVAPAGGRELRFEQRMSEDNIAPLFDGSAWAGTVVWEASLALAEEALARFRAELAAGARVLELGCGLGLPGMACAAVGARAVLTDVPEVFELLEHNVARNFGGAAPAEGEAERADFGAEAGRAGAVGGAGRAGASCAGCAGGGAGSARAAALRWEVPAAEQLADEEGGFDFVLCADCVYQPLYGESWAALAACIVALCTPRTAALVSVQRRHNDGVERFLARLASGLRVERVSTELLGGANVQIFLARQPRDGEEPGLLSAGGA